MVGHMTERERGGTGCYELRDERALGVQVVGLYWITPDGQRILVANFGRERVALLGEAVAAYLAGDPASAG